MAVKKLNWLLIEYYHLLMVLMYFWFMAFGLCFGLILLSFSSNFFFVYPLNDAGLEIWVYLLDYASVDDIAELFLLEEEISLSFFLMLSYS